MKINLKVFFLVLMLGVLAAPVSATNLVPNYSFESITNGSFDNWSGSYTTSTVSHTGSYSALIYDGGGAYGTNSGINSSTFDTDGPGTYDFGAWFSFGLAADPATMGGWPDDRFGISAVVNPIGNVDPTYPNEIYSIPTGVTLNWAEEAATGIYWSDWFLISDFFTVSADTTTRLSLYVQQYDTSVTGYARVDDAYVTVAPVPEPSTFLLLSAGLAGLGFAFRRRRKE